MNLKGILDLRARRTSSLSSITVRLIRFVWVFSFVTACLFLLAERSDVTTYAKWNVEPVLSKEQTKRLFTQMPIQRQATRLNYLFNRQECKEFVAAFPSSFHGCLALYGYDDEKGAAPLYDNYESHIDFFMQCPAISDMERLRGAIDIGIGGHWDADAVSIFREHLVVPILKNPSSANKILNRLAPVKAQSFWYFIADSPVPSDRGHLKEIESLTEALGKRSK